MKKLIQSFHLVTISPWPLFMSLSIFIEFWGVYFFFIYSDPKIMKFGIFLICLIMFCWWKDVVRESTFQGFHTIKVIKGLKLSMVMFIFSENMFFFSIFWGYFHVFLSLDLMIGEAWPPKGVEAVNPYYILLLNTVILLSSGVSITWCHHSIIIENKKHAVNALFYTILLGMLFTYIQYFEYDCTMYTMSDSVYGSIYYLSTGFHGLHVLIGTMFLLIMFIRLISNHFSKSHHVGLEMAIWYWHFVDVLWLFLFLSVYFLSG